MRTLATVAAAALTLAGCTPSSTAVEGSPPIGQVAITRLPQPPAHDPDRPLDQPPGRVDRNDPAAVAVALITAGLTEEGLEVLDLGVDTLAAAADGVTVRVAATHRAQPTSAPHTSVYHLHLTRDAGGTRRLVGHRQAQ